MKITAIVLATVTAFASTAAFAGGAEEPMKDETVAVTVAPSSSALPWWAVAAGVVAVGVALSQSK